MKIVEYLNEADQSPFSDWFGSLDAQAAAKVTIAIARMEAGAMSSVKSVGGGVAEYRIHWGAGYRIYFGRDGDEWVILLAGGTKRRQQRDIEDAQRRWADYKKRKKEGK
ncbi:type II toxin-antitoxin system RelE/ParE family toxin [Shimia sp. R11_0]|uniref:type II toxin-antitoxin system RelE/ParE family toxin n=1 Tax=Shimia sp. R11_0 TaxID=2821096 RepID=UPI001FFE008F|nr:type II toxin-antitoxin system RelE/ParE family toxin [Shimia sp. R11_0]